MFPVVKPLTRRMLQAYSPVKPSPLSRVLTVDRTSPPHKALFISAANLEDSFDSTAMETSAKRRGPLATLMEEDWAKLLEDLGKGKEVAKEVTLGEELGISMEGDPDPPLKARNGPLSPRKAKPSTTKTAATTMSATHRARAKVEVKKPPTTAATRDKGKAEDTPQEKVGVKQTRGCGPGWTKRIL